MNPLNSRWKPIAASALPAASGSRQQAVERERERYNALFHIEKRSDEENIEMAECCLVLIEKEIFTRKQLPTVVLRLIKSVKKPVAKLQKRIDALYLKLAAMDADKATKD